MKDSKKDTIKKSLANTRQRRLGQNCKVFELKLDLSHLSTRKLNDLNNLFKEAKWLHNHILSQVQENKEDFDIFKFNPLVKEVSILDHKKQPIVKELDIIGSQIKQGIHSRMIDSIKALSALKKNGFKVGKLKFKSRIHSIPLKQFGITWKFNNTKKNYIKIQGIRGYYKVSGVKQIPKDAEFANATLINRSDNFYLLTTCFVTKKKKVFKHDSVGIDFGIKDNIVLSNGEKFNVNIPETKRTRKLRKRLSRKQGCKKRSKKSKSYLKNLSLVNKSVKKTLNKKKDSKNKIVSYIVNNFKIVCVQDESIKEWKDGLFGKQVHNSVLGGIMRDLKTKSHTLKIVDKYKPTTQLCPNCFKLNKFGLKVRYYKCECGYGMDRDIHSAQNIKSFVLGNLKHYKSKSILAERKDVKILVEGLTSSVFDGKSYPVKLEAHDFSRG